MVPGGTTEIIWHFAGYLHLTVEEIRARLDYDEALFEVRQSDYLARLPNYDAAADLQEFSSLRGRLPDNPFEPQVVEGRMLPAKLADKLPPGRMPPPSEAELDKLLSIKPGGGGGGGTLTEKVIKVTYGEGEGQLQVRADQLNLLSDDDLFGVTADAQDLHNTETSALLEELTGAAAAKVPDEIALPQDGSEAVAAFVKARNDAIAAEETDGDDAVAPGLYINGELQPVGTEHPEVSDEDEAEPALSASGQWAELGGNTATNAALIVDLNEAAPSLVILGDYFKVDGIVQTNVFVDDDRVELGLQAPTHIVTGENTADNIAEFIRHTGLHGQLAGIFAGSHWNVDIIDGDFIDINLFTQKNYLQDNDVTGQDAWEGRYQVVAGENGAYNLSQLFEMASAYDVIIIGGDYHGANLIFQTNILLDSDVLKMVTGGGSPGAQFALTGENALLNDATIVSYGNDVFQPFNPAINDLVAALANRQSDLGMEFGELFPGNGSGALNVLYITGDYYDLNAMWQINVIADLDTALQVLAPTSATDEAITQQAETGSNDLSNYATIVDVGSTFATAEGDVYEDAILVQANLVLDDADIIINKDTNALISEVIAFTDTDPEVDSAEIAPPSVATPQEDVMGSVLS